MTRNTVLLYAALILLKSPLAAGAPAIPFGSHTFSYATHIKPNTVTQAQLDNAVRNFYNSWKTAYLQSNKCVAGHYRINYGGDQTVSEAHGYGMLTTVLMAGHDANAQTIFDGMYQYYRAHPATAPAANRLLAWKQDSGCNNIEGASSASDGDLDVAHSLLMADRQWGSCGPINYMAEALAMIAQIKQYDLNSTYKYVKLGNWATTGNHLNSTRSSDFMPDHYRSFAWASGDAAWTGLINHTYYLVSATAHATTGLMPDFIASPLSNPVPAPPFFLEADGDGKYNWNACRDPWRLATDYLVSGDARAKAAIDKMSNWVKTAPISGNPANVRAGYELNGTALVTYSDAGFTAPFAAGAMADAANQTLINSFWANAQVSGAGTSGYYGDSIKLLSMIVLTGNWWAPEAMPNPCGPSPSATASPTRTRTATPAVGSPTSTYTRTPTPLAATFTRTVTPVPAGSCPIVLAYYTSWADPYTAASIPYNKLTHICHAFIWPNADGTLNVPAGFVEPALLTNAHANGVKVLISLGGATQSGNFAGIANNAGYRATFVAAVKNFVLSNNYDGVDFDWEFPQNATDRNNFTLLVQDIRNAFNSAPNAHPEWLISGAYSWTNYYAQWYDLAALTPLVDFFNIMTYDAHGPWSPHSGHNAPLGAAAGDSDSVSMQAVMTYYNTTRGVPLNKLVFGLPFYGYNFPTEDLHQACATCGSDTPYVPYKDIPALIGNGWTRTWDASASSPKLRHDTQARTISYDDPQSIQAKSDWALNTKGLRGVFMWDLSLDHMGGGNQPLLDAMRAPLNCGASPTSTFTRSPTPVNTFSPSATASGTASATPTLTRTATRTASPTPTNSSTPSSTASPTSTLSSTPSRSATPSSSPTPSVTLTRTSTLSSTPSATLTRTATLTASASHTPSRTVTVTTTVTETYTEVPLSSSPTHTPTLSPTLTASPSVTLSSTPSLTATLTPSSTLTVTLTQTQQFSPSASPTLTAYPSPVNTPLNTATGTQTRTATPSSSPTRTVTITSTSTQTPLGTLTQSPQASPTATHTRTTVVPVLTQSPTPRTGGTLNIEKALPVPNPNPTIFYVLLSGWADQVELKLYSNGNTLIKTQVSGPHYPGWSIVYIPADFLANASNGTYFYSLVAKNNAGAQSAPAKGTLVIAR